jgi:hypothetical protein
MVVLGRQILQREDRSGEDGLKYMTAKRTFYCRAIFMVPVFSRLHRISLVHSLNVGTIHFQTL